MIKSPSLRNINGMHVFHSIHRNLTCQKNCRPNAFILLGMQFFENLLYLGSIFGCSEHGYWLIFFTITTKRRKARINDKLLRLLRFHLPVRHATFKESKLFWKEDFSAVFVCIHFPGLSNYGSIMGWRSGTISSEVGQKSWGWEIQMVMKSWVPKDRTQCTSWNIGLFWRLLCRP